MTDSDCISKHNCYFTVFQTNTKKFGKRGASDSDNEEEKRKSAIVTYASSKTGVRVTATLSLHGYVCTWSARQSIDSWHKPSVL